LVYIVVNVIGASDGVFMCFWWFGVSLLWFFPLQLGCAIVISPFNSASLMCVVCLGVSVLATIIPRGSVGYHLSTGLANL
jgi:hypothetical protein